MKYTCKCERCGNKNAEVDTSKQLESFPPKYKYVCPDCDYSGITNTFTFNVEPITPKFVNHCYICGEACKDDKEHICELCKKAIIYVREHLI